MLLLLLFLLLQGQILSIVDLVGRDLVFVVLVNTAGAEHEAVHTHAEMLPLGLETLPDKHAGSMVFGHLTTTRRNGEPVWNKKRVQGKSYD